MIEFGPGENDLFYAWLERKRGAFFADNARSAPSGRAVPALRAVPARSTSTRKLCLSSRDALGVSLP